MTNPSKTSLATAKHYNWARVADGWRLLDRPDLSVTYERCPPGIGEIRHRHTVARQFFWILDGEANLEIEGAVLRLGVGEGAEVAPGKAHRLWNAGTRDLLFFVVAAPNHVGDRVEAPA